MEQVRIATADGFSLRLPSGLARDLACQITEAANALPKRGLEVCGLFLGEMTVNEFVVNSVIPIPCPYTAGPSFRLPETEIHVALQNAGTLGTVLGIYRSRNDGSLDLDRQDTFLLGLIARHAVPVLVIRQQKDSAGEARLLIWRSQDGAGEVTNVGGIFPTRQWAALPPAPHEASKTLPSLHRRAVFRSVPVEPLHPRPNSETRLENPVRVRMAWVAAAALAVLLPLLMAWLVRPLNHTGPTHSPVVIAASPGELAPHSSPGEDPKSLRTVKTWLRNNDNPTLREIAVGLLARHWKQHPETLPLLNGVAQTDRSEIVRSAAREALARGWNKIPAVPRAVGNTRGEPPPAPPKPIVALAVQLETVAVPKASGIGSKLRKAARLFRLPWPHSSVPQPAELVPPPPTQVAENATPPPIPSLPLPALPRGKGQPVRPLRPAPTLPVRPPILVRRTPPIILPPGLHRLLRQETMIALRVHVDANGHVARIEGLEPAGRIERSLQRYYADGVRRWLFVPARQDHTPVPGEVILRFRITPQVPRP